MGWDVADWMDGWISLCLCCAFDCRIHLRLHARHQHVTIGTAAALGLSATHDLHEVGVIQLGKIGVVQLCHVLLLSAHKFVH